MPHCVPYNKLVVAEVSMLTIREIGKSVSYLSHNDHAISPIINCRIFDGRRWPFTYCAFAVVMLTESIAIQTGVQELHQVSLAPC